MGRSERWRETDRLVLTRQEVGSLGVSRKLESCQFPEPLAFGPIVPHRLKNPGPERVSGSCIGSGAEMGRIPSGAWKVRAQAGYLRTLQQSGQPNRAVALLWKSFQASNLLHV